MPGSVTGLYAGLVTTLMVYFIGTAFYWRRAYLSLREKPYGQMRMAIQHFRLAVRFLIPLKLVWAFASSATTVFTETVPWGHSNAGMLSAQPCNLCIR